MAVKVGFVILLCFLIFSFIKLQKNQNITIEKGVAVRLIIPKININAKVQSVGITKGGNMDVPSNSQDVGLFSLGPKLGELGSSVITGHFDDENGNQAVFYNLDKLVKGDKIFIEDNNKRMTFIIQEVSKFNEKYVEKIFSSNDMSHLNLITCNGVWNKLEKSYENRLVIFSDLVTEI